jgi:hypothetical protein
VSNPTVGEFGLPTPPPQNKNNNTKWIAAAIVAGLGLFGFMVQSSNNSEPVVQDRVVNTSPAPAPKYNSQSRAESLYIDAVHEYYPKTRYASDADLLELGYGACEIFDAGVTAEEYAYIIVKEFSNDADARELAATVAGAAIATLCTEHQWMLD